MELAGLTPEDSSPGRALTTAIISSWRDIGLKEWPEIRHGYGLIIPRPHQVLINMNESPFPNECTATIVPYSILLRFFFHNVILESVTAQYTYVENPFR